MLDKVVVLPCYTAKETEAEAVRWVGQVMQQISGRSGMGAQVYLQSLSF